MSNTKPTHNLEQETHFRSLSGKELPSDWPQIIPDEKFQYKFKGLDPRKVLVINKLSYELVNGNKRILYLAVHHTQDPTDPQLDVIERKFKEFKPQAVLYEGSRNGLWESSRNDVARTGDPGYVRFLVKTHNNNLKEGEEPIVTDSVDQPFEEWVGDFRKHGFTNEDIAVFVVLRHVHFVKTIKIKAKAKELKRALTKEEKERFLSDFEGDFRVSLETSLSNSTGRLFYEFSYLKREDDQPWNLRLLIQSVQKITGQDPGFSKINYPQDIKDIFNLQAQFRDAYMVKKIADTLKKHDRVMVVTGSSHPLRQETALRQFFG